DSKACLDAVESTRKDIVESGEKKTEDKKDGGGKKGATADPNKGQVSGHVTFKGKPLGSGFVTFVDANGRRYSANILVDGTYGFRIGVPPGEYSVIVEDSPTPPMPG